MGRARGRRGPDAKTWFGNNFIPVQLLSQQTFFCFSCWRESAQSHREKRTWAALGQRGHLVGTQRQNPTSASDFYFWLTFLVSGWLDSFCRDPLCFKQKYGTTCHVLVRTCTCVFICGNEFAEPLNFLLSWVVAQDVCLWHWIQRTFYLFIGLLDFEIWVIVRVFFFFLGNSEPICSPIRAPFYL